MRCRGRRVMFSVRGVFCSQGSAGGPALSCQDAVAKSGRVVGPGSILGIVGYPVPAVGPLSVGRSGRTVPVDTSGELLLTLSAQRDPWQAKCYFWSDCAGKTVREDGEVPSGMSTMLHSRIKILVVVSTHGPRTLGALQVVGEMPAARLALARCHETPSIRPW